LTNILVTFCVQDWSTKARLVGVKNWSGIFKKIRTANESKKQIVRAWGRSWPVLGGVVDGRNKN
jgi:hypothetical protein